MGKEKGQVVVEDIFTHLSFDGDMLEAPHGCNTTCCTTDAENTAHTALDHCKHGPLISLWTHYSTINSKHLCT